MNHAPLDIAMIGPTITSSLGNGHTATFRGLIRESAARGHRVLYLENDKPWYADNRDLAKLSYGEIALYNNVDELKARFSERIRKADLVLVGSFVPDGAAVIDWVQSLTEGLTVFYDIDPPLTLSRLTAGECEYLSAPQIRRFDCYLSFTGGPTLARLEKIFGAARARPLYCAADPELFYPETKSASWDLGYMGATHADSQEALDLRLLEPARRWIRGRFAVAGPRFPVEIEWPENVQRLENLATSKSRDFYNRQRFTLNITRPEMLNAGYSPNIRLFEAGACATPIISDFWEGLNEFFAIGREILVSQSPEDTLNYLKRLPEDRRREIGEQARARILREHTAAHRAEQLESYVREALNARARRRIGAAP